MWFMKSCPEVPGDGRNIKRRQREQQMAKYYTQEIPKTDRIPRLVAHLYAKMPEIESARAKLITESYKSTEDKPIIMRRALAFAHILDNIPIIIREGELVAGSSTIAPRGCQTYPEFSYKWLEAEFETVATRKADPFYIAEQTKKELLEADAYWEGRTTSELATSIMAPEARKAIEHNIFTPGNYFYNGVGHVTVQYERVLAEGYRGIITQVQEELDKCRPGDADYCTRSQFLKAVIISCEAAIRYANRYARLAEEEMAACTDAARKQELARIAAYCRRARASGSCSSCCSWSPAGIPSLRDASTSICTLITKRIWKRERLPGRRLRS